MKVISKYKDFYDYLSGIYGEDPLIVLDRREGGVYKPSFQNKIVLYIGGYKIEGYCPDIKSPHYNGGKIYWGNNLKTIDDYPNLADSYWKAKAKNHDQILKGRRQIHYQTSVDFYLKKRGVPIDEIAFIDLDEQTQDCVFYFKFRPDTDKINDKENCPIVVKTDGYPKKYFKYPSLSELNLNSYVKPEEVYQMVSAWLSGKKTEAENHIDTRTNDEKIVSKGFDKKISFRSGR